jgi:plastocyanin
MVTRPLEWAVEGAGNPCINPYIEQDSYEALTAGWNNLVIILFVSYLPYLLAKESKMSKKLLVAFFVMSVVLAACAPQAAPTTTLPAPSLPAASAGEAKITISGFAFDPATVTIKVGGTVTWTNQDSVAHTVAAEDNSWTSSNLGEGGTFSRTFDTAGTFTYLCSIHPSMKGTVIVQP